MASIEERAKESSKLRCKRICDDFEECFSSEESLKCCEYHGKVDNYIQIATDQRKRDIEKACKWLKEHVRSAYIDMGKCGLSECHVQEWWLEEFSKAMEEEQ